MSQSDTKPLLIDLLIEEVQDLAIFTLDENGTILSWNPGAEHVFGYSSYEAIGRSLGFLFPHLKTEGILHQDLLMAKKYGQYEHETYIRRKNGRKMLVRCIVTALLDKEKRLKGFSKIVWSLHRQQEKDKQREDFVKMAGHELKNPLTSITSYAQLIQKRLLTKQSDPQLLMLSEKLLIQTATLTRLINDLIAASKVALGTLPFQDSDRIPLDEFIHELVSQIQLTIPSHKIMIKGKSEMVILADKTRLEEVIVNVLNNAIKYSPGKKKIILTLAKTKTYVTITIEDFGIGISHEDQEKIFNRFYRSASAKSLRQGLGVGLSIVQHILHHYQGSIRVTSVPGKGSTFTISLPRTLATQHSS